MGLISGSIETVVGALLGCKGDADLQATGLGTLANLANGGEYQPHVLSGSCATTHAKR